MPPFTHDCDRCLIVGDLSVYVYKGWITGNERLLYYVYTRTQPDTCEMQSDAFLNIFT